MVGTQCNKYQWFDVNNTCEEAKFYALDDVSSQCSCTRICVFHGLFTCCAGHTRHRKHKHPISSVQMCEILHVVYSIHDLFFTEPVARCCFSNFEQTRASSSDIMLRWPPGYLTVCWVCLLLELFEVVVRIMCQSPQKNPNWEPTYQRHIVLKRWWATTKARPKLGGAWILLCRQDLDPLWLTV